MRQEPIDQYEAGPPLELSPHPFGQDARARSPYLMAVLLSRETIAALVRITTLVALDAAMIALALFAALVIKFQLQTGTPNTDYVASTVEAIYPYVGLVTILLFARGNLYAPIHARPGLARVVASLFQVTMLMLAFVLITGRQGELNTYYIFWGTLIIASVLITTSRYVYDLVARRAIRTFGHSRRAVVVGSNHQIEAVVEALRRDPHAGIDPIGYISLDERPRNGLRDLGDLSEIERHFSEIDAVVIADPYFPQDKAVDLVDRCHRAGVVVRVAPSTMSILTHRAEFVPGQVVPLFELVPPVLQGVDFVIKRAFDVACATVALIVLAPLFAVIALAIKLTSRGPVIYRCRRIKMAEEPFDCFKFRTMYDGSDALQAELSRVGRDNGPHFKLKGDPRVTPVGRILRRLSIDELPQLINVLRGEMSLVGPRPLPIDEYDMLEAWHKSRYHVLPGMTGLWQVSGRSELDFEDRQRLDYLYIETWSVFLDLLIMLKTIPAVLKRRGAW